MAKLGPDQIEVLRPLVIRLSKQNPSEESKSTDGALTLKTGLNFFPGATRVHVWQVSNFFSRRYVVDIVGPKGKVQTVRLKPREIY